MTSSSETGHAKNVANLFKYNQFLVGLGAKYNPGLPELSVSSMQALYTDAQGKVDSLKTVMDVWKTETNEREIAFSKLSGFCVRLLGILRSTTASQQMIDDLSALVGKQRSSGRRVVPPKPDATAGMGAEAEPEPEVTRSTSQLSFDQRIDNYSKVVVMLKSFAGYAPAEQELSILSLEKLHTDLVTLNQRASKADVELRNARGERNDVLYGKGTGMVDRVKRSKAYVLGVFGKSSREYKDAISYKFVNLMR